MAASVCNQQGELVGEFRGLGLWSEGGEAGGEEILKKVCLGGGNGGNFCGIFYDLRLLTGEGIDGGIDALEGLLIIGGDRPALQWLLIGGGIGRGFSALLG